IGLVQLRSALRPLGSRGAANLHDTMLHTPAAVAQLAPHLAGNLGDLLHDTGEYANSIGHPDAGKLAVDEIGTHLPLEHDVAPVASVLEDEQPDDHFRAKAA